MKFTSPGGDVLDIKPGFRITKKNAMTFWVIAKYHPVRVAKALFPDSSQRSGHARGAVKAVYVLRAWASNYTVIDKKDKNDVYQFICDGLEKEIPSWAFEVLPR